MKKLFAIFAAIILASGVSFAASIPAPDDEGMLLKNTQGGKASDPLKVYQIVRNGLNGQDDSTISSGAVVIWDTNSADGVTVTTTTTSADGAVAGILVTDLLTGDAGATSASDDNGRRNWGILQVYGPVSATITAGGSNGAAAKSGLITSSDAGVVTTFESGESDNLTSNKNFGFFLEGAANGTDTSVEVFVKTM